MKHIVTEDQDRAQGVASTGFIPAPSSPTVRGDSSLVQSVKIIYIIRTLKYGLMYDGSTLNDWLIG